MSYNTRRTGTRMGPQVNYHQAPQNARTPNRQMQNQGYSTAPSSNYQSGFSQGGYSSVQPGPGKTFAPLPQPQQQQPPQQQQQQQQPPPQSQQQQPPPQQQQQQQQQSQAPPVQQSNPPPQQQPTQQPPSTPKQAPPASAVKHEVLTPTAMAADPVPPPSTEEKPETNGEGAKKRPFWMRKGPAYKVSKKVKRRRQNARLRKILTPKNALMILNELHQGIKFTIQEQTNALSQIVYTVTVDVEGKQYHGQGISKIAAKQLACENALKSLLLEKMGKAVQENVEQMDQSQAESGAEDKHGDTDDNMDGSSVTSGSSRSRRPEDDVPWGCLASFALHKLFLEWQSQGIQVPMAPPTRISTVGLPAAAAMTSPAPKPSAVVGDSVAQTPGGSPMPMKKIPEDASKRNPVMLLNQLKPGCQYSEQRDGIPPNLTFTISVVVDGQEFVGVAGNKKDAKRECARAALAKMGIVTEN